MRGPRFTALSTRRIARPPGPASPHAAVVLGKRLGGKTMRDANRLVRHRRGVGQGWAPAGVGCLILLLCGCVPAVVMTSTYVDKRDQSEEPAQVSSASADQTQTDQRPLLTTKNYRDPAGGGQESTQVYRATFDQVWAAVLRALTQLKASVTSSTRDQAGGEIAGRWVGGQPLTMRVDQTDAHTIRVTVRVGQAGDRTAEDAIQAGIRGNL